MHGLIKGTPGVEKVEEVYAHRFGPYLVLNVTIAIDGSLSVAAGDSISCTVESMLYANIDLLRRVHVPYHPVGVTLVGEDAPGPRVITED